MDGSLISGSPAARAGVSAMIVVALASMVIEYAIARQAKHDAHDLHDSVATFAVAVGQAVVRVATAGLVAIPFAFVHAHRLFDVDLRAPWALPVLFVGSEFLYYWHHRASHRVRWFWASHAVHHSSTHLNLTAAIRLGWTANLSGSFLFFLPLVWVGFDSRAVIAMLGLNLLYQFFIHTELVPVLGPLEWIFNTPAQHRVHHASNAACIDRNYGGVLSIFDHLFGTFATAPKHEPLRYGLAGREPSRNPFRIALGEWGRLLFDVAQASSWHGRWRLVSGPPESDHKTPQAVVARARVPQTAEQPIGAGP